MNQNTYWSNISESISSLWKGLALTFHHLLKSRKSAAIKGIQHNNYFDGQQGIITIQYPHVSLPVPDTGRYRLHNEIDDCIVCDKCVKICPVNCIEIEAIRSPEEFGKTSDGTPKRIHAAKFNIDMSKCCFCGLCTTVCPTECLTMTKTYDFSTFNILDHNFAFAEMSTEAIEESKKKWTAYELSKQQSQPKVAPSQDTKPNRPVFKPKIKPAGNDGA